MQQPDSFPDASRAVDRSPTLLAGAPWRAGRRRRDDVAGLVRRRGYRAAVICRRWCLAVPAPAALRVPGAGLRDELAGLLRAVAGTVARRIDRRSAGKTVARGRRSVRARPWWQAQPPCGSGPAAARDGAGR